MTGGSAPRPYQRNFPRGHLPRAAAPGPGALRSHALSRHDAARWPDLGISRETHCGVSARRVVCPLPTCPLVLGHWDHVHSGTHATLVQHPVEVIHLVSN